LTGILLHTTEKIVAAFQASGRRMTRQRRAIIEYLAASHDHPSARQVFTAVQACESKISLATVYNTLATLVDLGFLKEMEFEARDNRYDTNVSPHINLVCTACGVITDFDRKPPVSTNEIRKVLGFETTDIRMEYQGVCAPCRSKEHDPKTEEP
jgi:Fur family peroxide stress response transcriptional regulator